MFVSSYRLAADQQPLAQSPMLAFYYSRLHCRHFQQVSASSNE